MGNRRLEKCLVWWLFPLWHLDSRVRICHKQQGNIDSSWYHHAAACGANVGIPITSWASFKCHRQPEYCCWTCPARTVSKRPPGLIWDVVEQEMQIIDVQLTNLQQLTWCYLVNAMKAVLNAKGVKPGTI